MFEQENTNLGALLDTRPKEEKQKDYQHVEVAVAATAPVEWVEKTEYKYFDKRNQAMSSSCMAQSGVKMLGIENVLEENQFVTLSAKAVYKSRTTPGGGMALHESLGALCKPLACFEEQLPSQDQGEVEINQPYTMTQEMQETAEKYRAANYVFVNPPNDIDAIASLVAAGRGVQVILFFIADEYWRNVPKIIKKTLRVDAAEASRHGVCVVDYTLYKGEKALVIEDSAGNASSIHGKGQRVLTETFFKARCYGAGYLLPLKNDHGAPKPPEHNFTKTLKYGMKDGEVRWLQDYLKYTGDFPTNIGSTGNFFGLTLKAVKSFQAKNGLVADGVVGKKTNAVLNALV